MKIVLCDDHAMWLEVLGSALVARGHTVAATATTPAGGVEAVATTSPDICALDIGFPDGDGFGAAVRIREEFPRTRVLMMTGFSEPALIASARESGASGFTCKDQSINMIVRALERVARGGTAFEQYGAQVERRRENYQDRDTKRMVLSLTTRERDVLRRLVAGRTTTEIAQEIGVTRNTARTHVQNVLMKLDAHSQLQATTQVVRAGLADLL
jgi:DNA-binding NarL/FixJ family response regulator